MPIKTVLGLADTLPNVYAAQKPKSNEREYITCPYEDIVGVEVEVENVTDEIAGRNSPRGWQMDNDGSLRNNGREYISRPTVASTMHWSLAALLEKHLDSKVQSFSPRTSIHLHVNFRDLEIQEAQNTIRYYCLFERLLFRFCGRSRHKNLYCVPLVDTNLMTGFAGRFPNTNRWPKYASLNAAPLTTYGTLEFRHMHGTFDVDKMMLWINLILSIVNYAKGKTDSDVMTEIMGCVNEGAYLELMDRVFKTNRNQLNYKDQNDYLHCYHNVLSSFTMASPMLAVAAKSALQERLDS